MYSSITPHELADTTTNSTERRMQLYVSYVVLWHFTFYAQISQFNSSLSVFNKELID